jgi:hypothetical protein
MFNDTKYPDATVVIHSKDLPVHKSVICTKSKYFEKALQSAFVGGSSGVLTFDNDSAAAHWRVLNTCTLVITRTIYRMTLRVR